MNLKILVLGDIVGVRAAQTVCDHLSSIKREFGTDVAIINAENVCLGTGNGLSAEWAVHLLSSGADVLTTGNHVWRQRCLYNLLDDRSDILRPANYPSSNPGQGYTIVDYGAARLLVMNVSGQQDLSDENAPGCPFDAIERILAQEEGKYDISILDIHAEATSEKAILSLYFDGMIDMIFGTHTHVQTADEGILPQGSGFITDVGMCGAIHSALGVEPAEVIAKMRTGMPQKFSPAQGAIGLYGVVFTVENGKVAAVERFRKVISSSCT